ncbi:hypothetical protein [Yoonia sp. R2-816]|uniref:hypothetical protein n=1 Tax=Yoonia sp. R2-816 TaxID=3342638 RepID=UPI003726E54D
MCFVDEYGTAGDDNFALGCAMVWSSECGKADKAFSDLLPQSVNEVHAASWAKPGLQSILAQYAQSSAPASLLMINKRSGGLVGDRPELYAHSLVETVKIGVRRFASSNGLTRKVGNVEVIIDVNEQNAHPTFGKIIEDAQRNDGLFRAVTRITPLDSAASRMLQLKRFGLNLNRWGFP